MLSLNVQGLVQVRNLLERLTPASRLRLYFRQGSPALVGILLLVLLLALGGRDSLLTVAEMARRLRVCKATVYKLVEQGRLAHVRVGNSIPFVVEPEINF